MSEKELLARFSEAIKKNRPKTKEEARQYLFELGVINKNGGLSKNYQSETNLKPKSIRGQ